MAIPPAPRVPQPSREDFINAIGGIKPQLPKAKSLSRDDVLSVLAPPPQMPTKAPISPFVISDPNLIPEPETGGGIFDIPIIGDVIDFVDTPRAILTSTVKEVGDAFRGDGFSVTDWWNQADDNMMMGEVLRDWGVELGGPWDFALGLGLDIAMDPLTYLLGGSAWARYASTDDTAKALLNAADAATDRQLAGRLRYAASEVKSKNSIYAAGREALEEIGIDLGLRFTVFGTGRMSRGIVERPLRKLFPEVGKKLDARRIAQLPHSKIANGSKFWRWGEEAIPFGPRFRPAIDFTDPKNVKILENQVAKLRAGKPLSRYKVGPRAGELTEAARLAQRAVKLPVESSIRIPYTDEFVRIVAGRAGSVLTGITATKIGNYLARQMSSKAPLNIGIREFAKNGDYEMMHALMNLKKAGVQGKLASDLWANGSWNDIRSIKRDADRLGIDFDDLIMNAAVEPKEITLNSGGYGNITITNPVFTTGFGGAAVPFRLDPRYVDNPAWAGLHDRAQQMWASMGVRANGALPYSTPLKEVKDEFYVLRALKADVAKNLNIVRDNEVFEISIGGVGVESGLRGSIFSRRKYATPNAIKSAIAEGDISVQEVFDRVPAVRDKFEIDLAAASDLPIAQRISQSAALDEALKDGLRFATVDNTIMQNRFQGIPLTDVVRPKQGMGGSIESQIKRIGTDRLGDAFEEMFTKDSAMALSRYVNMMQARIRSHYVMDYMNQIGVQTSGKNGAWAGSAAETVANQVRLEEAARVATIMGTKSRKGLLSRAEFWMDEIFKRAKTVAQYDEVLERPALGSSDEGFGRPSPDERFGAPPQPEISPLRAQIVDQLKDPDKTGARPTDVVFQPQKQIDRRGKFSTAVHRISDAEAKLDTIEEIMTLIEPTTSPTGPRVTRKLRQRLINLSPEALRLLQNDTPITAVGKPTLGQVQRAKGVRGKKELMIGGARSRAASLETYEEAVEFLVDVAQELRNLVEFRDELVAILRQMKDEGTDLPFDWLIEKVNVIDAGINSNKRWLEDVANTYVRNVIETDSTTMMAQALRDLAMHGLAGHYRWVTPKGKVSLALRRAPLGGSGGQGKLYMEEYNPIAFKSQRETWTGYSEPMPWVTGSLPVETPHGYNPRFFHDPNTPSDFWRTLRFSDEAQVRPYTGMATGGRGGGTPLTGPTGRPMKLENWVYDPRTGIMVPPDSILAAEIRAAGGFIGEGIPYEGRPFVAFLDENSPMAELIKQRTTRAMDGSIPQWQREESLDQLARGDKELKEFLDSSTTAETLAIDVAHMVPRSVIIEGPEAIERWIRRNINVKGRADYRRAKAKFTPEGRPSRTERTVMKVPKYESPVKNLQEVAAKTGDVKSITFGGYMNELEQLAKVIDDEAVYYSWLNSIDGIRDGLKYVEGLSQRHATMALGDFLSADAKKAFLKGMPIPDAETTTISEYMEILEQQITMYRARAQGGETGLGGFIKDIEDRLAELQVYKANMLNEIDIARERINNVLNEFIRLRREAMKGTRRKPRSGYIYAEVQYQSVLDAIDAKNLSVKKITDNLRLRLDELRESAITRERLSAIDVRSPEGQKAALKEIQKVRNYSGFADVYGAAANDFMLQQRPFYGGLGKAPKSRVSDTTKRTLASQNLVGANIDDDQLIAYAEAFQAVARTQDPKVYNDFMQKYLPLVNYWKAWAVSTTGFFMRNLLGGVWINSALKGVPMHYHARVNEIRNLGAKAGKTQDVMEGIDALIAANKPVRLSGVRVGRGVAGSQVVTVDELKAFKLWNETGIGGSGQVSLEIQSQVDDFATWKSSLRPWKKDPEGERLMVQRGQKSPFTGSYPYLAPEFKPISWIRSRNQDTEYMLRGAMAHDVIMSGGTLEEAMEMVIRHHFDYSDLTNAERSIKGVIPFWTWQKHIVPVLIESIGKKPAAWGRLAQVKKELELHSPMEGIVPDYFGENMGIRLPFSTAAGRVYWLPDLPFRDLTKWTKDMDSSSDLLGIPQNFWRVGKESAFPPIKLPFELWAGKQTFADIPLTGRYQQAPSWAQIPVIKDALLAMNVAVKTPKGDIKMRDKHIYMFDQVLPIFGRMRRLFPNEERKQKAFTTTFINTFFGAGVRVNSTQEQMSQIAKNERELQENMRDLKDMLYRRV